MNLAGSGLRYLALTPASWLAPEPWLERRRSLGRWTLVHASGLAGRDKLEELR
jgi:hypothetical protein